MPGIVISPTGTSPIVISSTGTSKLQSGLEIVIPGLIVNYDFQNTRSYPGTGTAVTDLGPYGNNATLVGAPAFSSTAPQSFQFDGTGNQYVTVTENFGMTPQIVTVDFVVKINSNTNTPLGGAAGNYQNLIFRQNTVSNFGFEAYSVYYDELNGRIGMQNSTAAAVEQFIESANNSASVGTIYHISAVFNSTLMSLYINGTFAGSAAKATGIDYNATHTMKIGRCQAIGFAYDEPANASIYNVRLYNRALSASEVSQNYLANKSVISGL